MTPSLSRLTEAEAVQCLEARFNCADRERWQLRRLGHVLWLANRVVEYPSGDVFPRLGGYQVVGPNGEVLTFVTYPDNVDELVGDEIESALYRGEPLDEARLAEAIDAGIRAARNARGMDE
jgi:hypothetical protein